MAAVAQAGIGNVAAGSAFAVAQSVGMGGAVPAVITAVGAGLSAGVGTLAAGMRRGGKGPKEGRSTDKDATGEDAADEDGTSVDAGEGATRTGLNRCSECKRRDERYCRHR
jgi:hypothetical protein